MTGWLCSAREAVETETPAIRAKVRKDRPGFFLLGLVIGRNSGAQVKGNAGRRATEERPQPRRAGGAEVSNKVGRVILNAPLRIIVRSENGGLRISRPTFVGVSFDAS